MRTGPRADRIRAGLGALALALLGGCATLGNFQTPETAGKGRLEFGIEPSYYQRSLGVDADVVVPSVTSSKKVIIDGQDLNDALGLEQGVPNLSGSLRYGIADRVDLGLRWGANGIDVLGKVQLTPRGEDQIVVSVIPSMGGVVVPTEAGTIGMLDTQLAVLVGMKTGGRGQIVFGPKVQSWQAQGSADGVDVTGSYIAVGGSAGYAIRLSPSIRLLPEVALAAPLTWKIHAVHGEEVFQTTELPEGQAMLLQAGVALLLGNRKQAVNPADAPSAP